MNGDVPSGRFLNLRSLLSPKPSLAKPDYTVYYKQYVSLCVFCFRVILVCVWMVKCSHQKFNRQASTTRSLWCGHSLVLKSVWT